MERRRDRDFEGADAIRDRLRAGGWDVVDTATGSELQAIKARAGPAPQAVPRAVTLLTVVHGWRADAERWLFAVFTQCKTDFEAIVVDNSGDPRIAGWLAGRAAERLRVITLDPPLGFAAAVNAGIPMTVRRAPRNHPPANAAEAATNTTISAAIAAPPPLRARAAGRFP